jgi:hypothetical protein
MDEKESLDEMVSESIRTLLDSGIIDMTDLIMMVGSSPEKFLCDQLSGSGRSISFSGRAGVNYQEPRLKYRLRALYSTESFFIQGNGYVFHCFSKIIMYHLFRVLSKIEEANQPGRKINYVISITVKDHIPVIKVGLPHLSGSSNNQRFFI